MGYQKNLSDQRFKYKTFLTLRSLIKLLRPKYPSQNKTKKMLCKIKDCNTNSHIAWRD